MQGLTQKGNMETRQMTHFLHLLFPLWLFVTFVSEFENTQSSFSCGPSFDPVWYVKYLKFWPKTTDLDSSSYFSRK